MGPVLYWFMFLFGLLFTWKCCAEDISIYYLSRKCGETVRVDEEGLDEFEVKLGDTNSYAPNTDCQMTVWTAQSKRILYTFLDVSLADCADYVDIYSNNVSSTAIASNICQNSDKEAIPDNYISVIRFRSDASGNNGGFRILASVFYFATDGVCEDDGHFCRNGRCIANTMTCNDRNNCGNDNDEFRCAIWWFLIIALVSFAVLALVSFVIYRAVLARSVRKTVTPRLSPVLQDTPEIPIRSNQVTNRRKSSIKQDTLSVPIKPSQLRRHSASNILLQHRQDHADGLPSFVKPGPQSSDSDEADPIQRKDKPPSLFEQPLSSRLTPIITSPDPTGYINSNPTGDPPNYWSIPHEQPEAEVVGDLDKDDIPGPARYIEQGNYIEVRGLVHEHQ